MDPGIAHELISYLAPGSIVAIVAIFIGGPIARALAQRITRGTVPAAQALDRPAAADLAARLERIEQAVDSVAIEVERIAEAQRYTAQLQTRQAAAGALPPGS